MPVVWILIVGALLYMALQMLEKHHSEANKKRNTEKPCGIVPEASGTTVASEPAPVVTGIEKRPFLDTVAGLPSDTKEELMQLNLTTPEAISGAPDKTLLAIKGIGPARLKQLRGLCDDAAD